MPFWNDRNVSWTNALQALVWGAVAASFLPSAGHFLLDEARFYDSAVEVLEQLRPAAYGQSISGTDGQLVLTPGGGFYDLMAPAFIATRDPRSGTLWVVVLSALGMVLLDRALRHLRTPPFERLATVTLATWCAWHARFADRLWNPHTLLFTVPLLLWITARTLSAMRLAWLWAFAWGMSAALVLQCHLTGAPAIPLCLIAGLTLGNAPGLRLQLVPPALAGGLFAFLPYLLAETKAGFSNTRLLAVARPAHHLLGSGFGRSLVAALKLGSQLDPAHPFRLWPLGWSTIGSLSAATMAVLWILGLVHAPSSRKLGVATLLAVPLSFVVTGRDYFDHYTLFAYPFFFVAPASGLAWVVQRSRRLGVAAGVGLACYVALGVVFLVREYGPGKGDFTIARQEEIAAHLATARVPVWLSMGSSPADEVLIYEVLARRVFGVVPELARNGAPCSLDDRATVDPGLLSQSIDHGWRWLSCPRGVLPLPTGR
jgi:hypothetical protein